MTNRSSQRQRQRNQRNARTRRNAKAQRGGDLSGNPASAWGWGLGTVGNGWTQFMNSLTLQPGQNLGTIQSNNIVPVKNINLIYFTKIINFSAFTLSLAPRT